MQTCRIDIGVRRTELRAPILSFSLIVCVCVCLDLSTYQPLKKCTLVKNGIEFHVG